jgi:hypothetical protein
MKTVCLDNTTAIRSTPWAILCRVRTENGGFECWTPLSQIAEESEVRNAGDRGRLVVSAWWYHTSKTDKQFPKQLGLQASPRKKSHKPPTRCKDSSGFKEEDFNFEEDRTGRPEADTPRVEITDDDVPF